MTAGGVVFTFVTVTVPLAFVMTRIGATTRPRADVDVMVVLVDDAVAVVAGVVVVAWLTRRLPSAGLAARVGLGVTLDVSAGESTALFVVAVTVDVPVGPAANWPGVAVRAAVTGVASALLLRVAAAVVDEVVAPVTGVAAVAPVVAAAVVPVVAPVVAALPMKTPPSLDPVPLVMTGVGSELIDAFTVACGFAYAEGELIWFDGGAATVGCGPLGLITPRNRSR